MGWNPFKTIKKVVKSVTKVVKKVAKAVVKVGKKVVSGVKKAVKTVGKSLSKLGPLASIALMAIPGFQAFAAGLAGGLGFSSTLAANVASGALTGFITSGGNLKSAVVGGVMGGAGSYLGDAAKGTWKSGSLSTGFAQANAAAMAPSTFTGGLTGAAGFEAGMKSASQSWGNFTDSVGKFFSSNSPTGDIVGGTEAFAGTYEKYGMSPQEYMDTYNKLPDVATSAGTQQQQMLYEQNKDFFGTDAYGEAVPAGTKVETEWGKVTRDLGIDPTGQQAKMLAEQQFAGADGVYDPDLAFTSTQDLYLTASSGTTGTPTFMTQAYAAPTKEETGMPKGLLSPDATSFSQVPFVMTDPGKGIGAIKATGAVGGAGGMLGFTDVQRQTQAQLIAQAEQQAELARKRAASGWGVG